ncbi:hypothetical protein [Streptomyces sp. NPDC056817]|uniref:hypothetical protein n=1 Tax=Streptomyces sp. NPDC056817 TaxID=3345950 RepID=UPI0036C4E85E
MSTEIVKQQSATPATLDGAVRFAQLLADADLLPRQFVGRPANVLYAVEYGRTLGITPVAAITGIHVIEGKPSASSGLIGALVRKAGHKLRVKSDGMTTATAQIVRADDPDFTYECTWNLERAAQASLCKIENGKPVARDRNGKPTAWEKYPAAMLKARAITEVARDACEDVLFGLHYTPEELGAHVNQDGEPIEAEVQQLHRVQSGEADPWATPAPEAPAPQWVEGVIRISEAAEKATDPAVIRDLYRQANSAGLLAANALVKLGGAEKSMELGAFLVARGEELAAKPPANTGTDQDEGVTDAEIVPDEEADHAAAVAELREAAEAARLEDFDQGAAMALGMPIEQASTDAIRALAAQIRPAAA